MRSVCLRDVVRKEESPCGGGGTSPRLPRLLSGTRSGARHLSFFVAQPLLAVHLSRGELGSFFVGARYTCPACPGSCRGPCRDRAPLPIRAIIVSMRGGGQNLNELELFDSRRSQELRAEACSPMGFQIGDAVLRAAHLNAGIIVEVVNQQDGHEPPIAIIADCPGHARVERAGPSPIRVGLV